MAYYNEENLDEPDPICENDDADTIRMDSPEFWKAVDDSDLPNFPDSPRLSESTTPSTFIRYPACREFDITRKFQDPEPSPRETENGFDSYSVIVESDSLTYEEFQSLRDPHNMRRYFDKLTAASTSWTAFQKSCPRLDKFVFQHYDNNNYLFCDEVGLSLRNNVKQRWSLREVSSPDSIPRCDYGKRGSLVRWYDDYLRWDSGNMRFELKPYHIACLPIEHVDSELELRGFLYHISSSLLLYRLTLFTGEIGEATGSQTGCPWDITDGYKSSWKIPLRHMDNLSTLSFYDYKGQARALFSGSEEAQNDAVELVNLLTSFSFPHTYDGIMAGTVA